MEFSHMGKNSGNPDLVCKKIIAYTSQLIFYLLQETEHKSSNVKSNKLLTISIWLGK